MQKREKRKLPLMKKKNDFQQCTKEFIIFKLFFRIENNLIELSYNLLVAYFFE